MKKEKRKEIRCQLKGFDSTGLILAIREEPQMISWNEVEYIYTHRSQLSKGLKVPIDCILKDGRHFRIRFLKKDTQILLAQLNSYFEDSLRHSKMESNNFQFYISESWLEDYKRNMKQFYILYGISLLFWLTYMSYHIIKYPVLRNMNTIVFFVLTSIVLIVPMLISKIRTLSVIIPTYLKIENSDIYIFEDCNYHKFSLSDIKQYKLNDEQGKIVFNNGKKLCKLEKVNYWPLLRNFILDKFENEVE